MSKDYWINRSKDKLKQDLYDYKETIIKIKNNYLKILSLIEDEIYKLYGRYSKDNQLSYQEANKMLTESEYKAFRYDLLEYVKKIEDENANPELLLELNTLSAKSQISRLENLFYEIQKKLDEDYSFKKEEVKNLLEKGVRNNFYQTAYGIDLFLGLHSNFSVLNDKDIENIIKIPWSGKNYSQRLWNNRTKLKHKIEEQIIQATIQGKDLKKCAKDISNTFDASIKVSQRLINTEHAYACSQGDKLMYKELGVDKYEYLATLDIKTSNICRELDKKEFKVDDAVVGVNYPPMHPHCRSTTIPVLDDSMETTRISRDENNKNTYVPSNMNYKEWYKEFVENNGKYKIKELKYKNRHADKKQYIKYKNAGVVVPKSFEKYQEIKYNGVERDRKLLEIDYSRRMNLKKKY